MFGSKVRGIERERGRGRETDREIKCKTGERLAVLAIEIIW
jgi:hypothetical protein